MDRDLVHRPATINLINAPSELPASTSVAAPNARKPGARRIVVAAAVVLVPVLLGGGYYLFAMAQKPATVARVQASPSPSQTPQPTITPIASPTPSPTPVPTATPVPVSVSAPAAAPTSSQPQAVTVKSPSGLWLRSTPDSSTKNNIIGWMPNGATVSVDQVGDFWWHGTYSGKTGYFAVSFTH